MYMESIHSLKEKSKPTSYQAILRGTTSYCNLPEITYIFQAHLRVTLFFYTDGHYYAYFLYPHFNI